METKAYICNQVKLAVSIVTALVSGTLAFTLLTIGRTYSALFFIAIALVYAYTAVKNGSFIEVSDEGVRCRVFRKVLAKYTWDEIREIGVVGSRAFSNGKHTGTLNIYISKTKLSEHDRFDLVLAWPPKDKLYLTYNKARMEAIQLRYSNKIQTYNAGDLML